MHLILALLIAAATQILPVAPYPINMPTGAGGPCVLNVYAGPQWRTHAGEPDGISVTATGQLDGNIAGATGTAVVTWPDGQVASFTLPPTDRWSHTEVEMPVRPVLGKLSVAVTEASGGCTATGGYQYTLLQLPSPTPTPGAGS